MFRQRRSGDVERRCNLALDTLFDVLPVGALGADVVNSTSFSRWVSGAQALYQGRRAPSPKAGLHLHDAHVRSPMNSAAPISRFSAT